MATGRIVRLAIGMIVVLVFASCGDDEPSALSLLGGSCRLNSDCDGGLACAYGVCHEECATSKDCAAGRCILGLDRVRHCQPDTVASCTFHSDCKEPLSCARDGQCRNECDADRDCVPGQICAAATCADPDELDEDGKLPPAGDPLGKPCLYASDCTATQDDLVLVCRDGACGYACFVERDCGRYLDCTTADDPDVPGNCELIGPIEALICDPDDENDVIDCVCAGAPAPTARCAETGTEYEDCSCPAI